MTESFGFEKASRLESFAAMIALGVFVGWYHILILTISTCATYAIYFKSPVAVAVIAVILSAGYWPCYRQKDLSIFRTWLFRACCKYFPTTFDLHEKLVPGRRYMLAEFPHGVFPLGSLLSSAVIEPLMPGMKIAPMSASVLFRVPLMRQYMSYINSYPATKKNISKCFDRGETPVLVVGGIAEMFMCSEEVERIYLKKRKGFVKQAIQNGASLVPVFFFGNSLLLKMPQAGGWLSKISRKMQMSMIIFFGRFGLPIPFRRPMHGVSGKSIPVKQNDNPSDQYIDEIHTRFTEAVKKLYYENRPKWEKRELSIE